LDLGTLWYIYKNIISKPENIISKFFSEEQIQSICNNWLQAKEIRNKIAHPYPISKEDVLKLKDCILNIWSNGNWPSFEKMKNYLKG
jgi:hypothetical protein